MKPSLRPSQSTPKFSNNPLDSIFNNNSPEWRNINEVVRNSLQTLSSMVASQEKTIEELKQALNARPSKIEVQQALSNKVDLTEYVNAINDINKSLTMRPSVDEISSMNEDKVSKKELQSALSQKLSIEDAKCILDKKSDVIETNQNLISMQREIDNLSKEFNKKISQCALSKDISKLSAMISQKASICEMNDLLNLKISKEEMINALRSKANKIDVDQCLKTKIDVTELNDIISILNTKTSYEDLDKIYDIVNTKLDKSYLSSIKDNINMKLDISEFEAFIREYNDKSGVMQKKVDDIDQDLDNLISNIKTQFSNVNVVLTTLDRSKVDLNQLEKINVDISKRINEETLSGTINKIKFDIDESINEIKAEIELNKKNSEMYINSKIDMEKNEIDSNIAMTNRELSNQIESLKKLYSNYDLIKKNFNDLSTKITFISSETNGKFNTLFEALKEKVSTKDFINTNSKLQNDITMFYNDALESKATYTDLKNLYQKMIKDVSSKINIMQNSIFKEMSNVNCQIEEVSKKYISKENHDSDLLQQKETFVKMINDKASNDDIKTLQSSIEKITHDLIDKTDFTKFDALSTQFKTFSSDITDKLNIKADTKEMNELLSNKASTKELKELNTSITNILNEKVNKENYVKMLINQSTINDLFSKENTCGKWLWSSGKLKNAYNIPWEEEIVNTMNDNFYWEKDKSSLMIAIKGIYCITVGIFCGENKANVFLLINGEKVNGVEGKEAEIIPRGKKDVEVANVYIKEYVCVPERARISVEIRNENNEMFIGDKVKGFIIIKKI